VSLFKLKYIITTIIALLILVPVCHAQGDNDSSKYAPIGLVLFLFGGFCALWAQNTRRNPWLWFFFGFFLSALAVIALLIRNRDDRMLNNN